MAGALAADTLDVKLDENGTSFSRVSSAVTERHGCVCGSGVILQ
jgi:hypothetical protein